VLFGNDDADGKPTRQWNAPTPTRAQYGDDDLAGLDFIMIEVLKVCEVGDVISLTFFGGQIHRSGKGTGTSAAIDEQRFSALI
jgi:hypothetical protein